VGVSEALAGVRLQAHQRLIHGLGQALWRSPGAHVLHARLGGDREPGWHEIGPEDTRHLRDARSLAAEQFAHVARPLPEVVDPLGDGRRSHQVISGWIDRSARALAARMAASAARRCSHVDILRTQAAGAIPAEAQTCSVVCPDPRPVRAVIARRRAVPNRAWQWSKTSSRRLVPNCLGLQGRSPASKTELL
jgi:hypothetical protein